jgi:hypothetical protein
MVSNVLRFSRLQHRVYRTNRFKLADAGCKRGVSHSPNGGLSVAVSTVYRESLIDCFLWLAALADDVPAETSFHLLDEDIGIC